jgi:addiction module HigA family antidote
VIKSFRCEQTEQLYHRRRGKRFQAVELVTRRKLRQLDSATELRDLVSPPGNRLEALLGDRLPPIHPGEIFRQDFLQPLQLSMNKLAMDLHVPVTRIAAIVHERRGIAPRAILQHQRAFPVESSSRVRLRGRRKRTRSRN